MLELGGLLPKLYTDQVARQGRWAQVEARRHWARRALGEQAQGAGAQLGAGRAGARLGRRDACSRSRGAQARGGRGAARCGRAGACRVQRTRRRASGQTRARGARLGARSLRGTAGWAAQAGGLSVLLGCGLCT